jgi:hypothetical protein
MADREQVIPYGNVFVTDTEKFDEVSKKHRVFNQRHACCCLNISASFQYP